MARRHALWRFFSCCATPRTADVELAPVRRTSSAPVTSVTTRGLATAADSTAPQAPVAVAHALGKAGADSQTTSSQTTPRHKPLHRTSAHGKHKNDSKVVQAWKHGVLGFTFSGGGFLLPFYAGVAHQLLYMGLIEPGKTHLAGSSAGSLIAACVNAGVPPETVLATCLAVASNCRHHGVHKRLSGFVSAQLRAHLPHDAHIRCSGRTHVGITRVWPLLKSQVISEFSTRDELMSALLASCHIPLLSDGNFFTQYKGSTVVDGGMTALIPPVPSRHRTHPHSHIVKVSCFPKAVIPYVPVLNRKEAMKGLALAPDLFHRAWPYTPQQTLQYSLEPGPHSFLVSLVEWGAQDALSWAQHTGLVDHIEPHRAQLAPSLIQHVPETDPTTAEREGSHTAHDPPPHTPTLQPTLATTPVPAAAATAAASGASGAAGSLAAAEPQPPAAVAAYAASVMDTVKDIEARVDKSGA